MEKLLLDAMALDCKYTMRLFGYPKWTDPLFLSSSRIKKIMDDISIAEVRIIITKVIWTSEIEESDVICTYNGRGY